jgi:hypothetical protein
MTSYRKSHIRITAAGAPVRVRQSRVRDRKDEEDVLEMIAAGAVYLGEVGSAFNGGYSTSEISVFGVLLLVVGAALITVSD